MSIIGLLFSPSGDEDGGGSFDVVKVWETELIIEMFQGDEARYSLLPVRQRAKYICARKISEWISALDWRFRDKPDAGPSDTA